jgi:glycosyltransferase involved in cell wall biosynthesis
MRIAQVDPLCESVPPRVISWLTDALVALGHDVTRYASGDSLADAGRHDVIHFHSGEVPFPLLRRRALPHVTTLHGALAPHDAHALLDTYPGLPLVSISMSQRLPASTAGWVGNVPHGLPADLHTLGDGGGGYLAFLGRATPESGLERAVEITRRAGARLAIAARLHPAHRAYHARVIEPLLAGAAAYTELAGELDGAAKNQFLGAAHALLVPIAWEAPFGLAMIEAMACGTPVIAWRRGAVPEVIEHGVTGFIVDDVDEAVRAVRLCGDLDRARIRRAFLERFDATRMAEAYVEVYEAQLISRRDPLHVRGCGARTVQPIASTTWR